MIVLATQWMHSVNNRPEAVEVLARMVMPSKRVAAPGEFMPATRMSWCDLDVKIFTILNHDSQLLAFQKPIFVKISPETLAQPYVFGLCADLLADLVNRKQARIVVEVTRDCPLQAERIGEIINVLHGAGISVAFDDFGVSNSTAERFDSHQWDYCKVDLSTLKSSPDLDWLFQLERTCAQRGTRMVFERIERFQDVDLLKGFPTALIQGYAISRPGINNAADTCKKSVEHHADFANLAQAV